MVKKVVNEDEKEMKDRDVIAQLRKFLSANTSYNASIFQRTKMEDEFASGDQYDGKDNQILGANGARLTIDLISKYENSIVNKFSTNPFGITVSPKTEAARQKALKLTSLIRGIEYNSNANDEYVNCLRSAVRTGYGYLYVTSEYKNDETFDQQVIISSVRNSRCVAFGDSNKLDGSDVNEVAFIDHMSESEAIGRFGKDVTRESKYSLNGMDVAYDIPEDSVPYVVYFKREFEVTKLYKSKDGRQGKKEDFDEKEWPNLESRDIKKYKVKVYKIIGNKIESENVLPISFIPVIPFYGRKITLKGKNQYVGIVYSAKDAQKLINYNASKMAERIARSPKNQWIAPEESINNDPNWVNADTGLYSILTYKEKDGDGNPISGKPTLQQASTDITDVLTAKKDFEMSLSNIIGIPEQGSDGVGAFNETAVGALIRKDTIATNNSHFYYNAKSSIKHLGRILVEMINAYYDTPREEVIIDSDGNPTRVMVDVASMEVKPDDYDVCVEAGPIQANVKQETLTALVSFGSMLNDQQKTIIAPDVARMLPYENAELIAAKLEKTLPPELLDVKTTEDPVLRSQLDMANQALAAITAEKDEMQNLINNAYQTINSLQTYITAQREKTQAEILMNQQDNEVELQKVAMQEDAANQRQTQKIIADAAKEKNKQQQKLEETIAKAPKIVAVVDTQGNVVKPNMNKVNI